MTTASYFGTLQAALRAGGYIRPTLVVDRDRLDHNIAEVMRRKAPQLSLRIVDKSLPALPLIAHVLKATGGHRIMSFHLPISLAVLSAFPEVEILYGKPMPVGALRAAWMRATADQRHGLFARVVWLIDTIERLQQYADLAQELGQGLRFAFEVNVGMHRGGLASPADLAAALEICARTPQLRCQGIMGYEAHVPAIPAPFGGPAGEMRRTSAAFAGFKAVLGPGQQAILNTGGSKTALLYEGDACANEVSIGSALVLPTDFECAGLAGLQPASFIATPVIKVVEARLPGPLYVTRLMQALGRFPRRACFLYGGKWMAQPAYPPGLGYIPMWGDSSNQQMMAISAASRLRPDDHVFFRPTQSEAVLQQFGPIAVFSEGRIVDEWAALPTG